MGSSVSMSFEDWLLRTQSTLAEDQMGTTAKLNNYLTVNNTVYTDRDSVSGVDLNDEAHESDGLSEGVYRRLPADDSIGRGSGFPDQRHGCLRSGTGTIRGIDYDSYYN